MTSSRTTKKVSADKVRIARRVCVMDRSDTNVAGSLAADVDRVLTMIRIANGIPSAAINL
jgi:hypothetical protein